MLEIRHKRKARGSGEQVRMTVASLRLVSACFSPPKKTKPPDSNVKVLKLAEKIAGTVNDALQTGAARATFSSLQPVEYSILTHLIFQYIRRRHLQDWMLEQAHPAPVKLHST